MHPKRAGKRRTTLSLPAETLGKAERVARARRVNLSAVVGEALEEGLRVQSATERSEEVLESYRRAFAGFSDDETAVLDGIVWEPADGPRR